MFTTTGNLSHISGSALVLPPYRTARFVPDIAALPAPTRSRRRGSWFAQLSIWHNGVARSRWKMPIAKTQHGDLDQFRHECAATNGTGQVHEQMPRNRHWPMKGSR